MGESHGGTRRFGLFLKGSMDMKYLILAVALVASLATADFAEARGHRGCSSCSLAAAPAKMATSEAPKPDAAVATAAAPAPQATGVATVRRFGRRR